MQFENNRLQTSVKQVAGVHIVKVSGEIDVYTAPEFKSAIGQAILSGAKDIIIDLADVDYMDSSGFGSLLGATKRVRPKGGSINLFGCSEAIERMLKITRLDTIFGIFPNLDAAVEFVKSK